ncbi:cation:proton antiporter regulatory subunit [Streptomyces sp.]|uniref:cation:proton antiporter regulatory subunit n=1 Tax=Streptomyces sp. TaxID=1931 RepID=UPI002D2C3EA4|nr:cation:proton antiporter regulatory subunit [Streptomyces sp.]HZF90661.1 cation:proton antiporter regulatory subunit [Streptomyces sp.]
MLELPPADAEYPVHSGRVPSRTTTTTGRMGWVRVDVNEVLLPGVGLLYEFVNLEGDRIGVVARRSGDFEVAVYGEADPDQARAVFRLTGEEADVLAEILGAPRIAERFADLTKEVPGLSAGQVEVPAGTPFVGRPLGESRARTRTGASIVAIVRGEDVIPSPGPEKVLSAGDVLVVIGTREGIAAVEQLVRG